MNKLTKSLPMDDSPRHIIVVGASGGIGRAVLNELSHRYPEATLHATYHQTACQNQNQRVHWQQLDVRKAEHIRTWANTFDSVDWIINCVGYLHGSQGGPEKNVKSLDAELLVESIRINTLPTLELAKYFAAALKNSVTPKLAAISARVGSIEDNRLGGWYSYRISKAALNMALKTLSIEWKHSHPRGCVAALHPGTNDTTLSRPFQSRVAAEDLFKPSYTASMLVNLVAKLEPAQTGKFWTWDGDTIPW